jgi:hypothetical protein
MARATKAARTCWGEQRLAVGESLTWQVGPLLLSVLRGRGEWQVAHRWDSELEESQECALRPDAGFPEKGVRHERFVLDETTDTIDLHPALADRPVVSSPRLPFHLLPECEVTLFVGSPLWVRLAAGSPPVTLRELPSRRPSDTWFGGRTGDGEPCYATRTHARLDRDNLPVLRRSAVTAVRIRNRAAETLPLETLKLPVPLLSLFSDRERRLWTEDIVLTRSSDEGPEMASLDIRSGPPEEAATAELLTPARATAEPNLWIRAFSSLFGGRPGEGE